MDFKKLSLPQQHYLYTEHTVAMDGPAIAGAMEKGFGAVYGFTMAEGIERLLMPSAIYLTMPADGRMTFRTAIFVSKDDAMKAKGDVYADTLPKGEAITTTHVGPYANLNQTHGALWAYMEEAELPSKMPVWEIYVDDPTTVSEAECRTEVYRMIGQ